MERCKWATTAAAAAWIKIQKTHNTFISFVIRTIKHPYKYHHRHQFIHFFCGFLLKFILLTIRIRQSETVTIALQNNHNCCLSSILRTEDEKVGSKKKKTLKWYWNLNNRWTNQWVVKWSDVNERTVSKNKKKRVMNRSFVGVKITIDRLVDKWMRMIVKMPWFVTFFSDFFVFIWIFMMYYLWFKLKRKNYS